MDLLSSNPDRDLSMDDQNVSTYSFRQLERTLESDRTPEEILTQAHQQAQAIREAAHAEGVAAGHAEGIERARGEVRTGAAALAEAVRGVGATRAELVETLTLQAGEISVLIAEQVVGGAFAAQPERVIDVTRGALRRLADRHRVTLLVNPEDLELLSGAVEALQAELGGIEHLDVQADRRVERGGAIARTTYGEIDVTVGAQLQAAREIVQAALAGDTSVSAHADGDQGEAVSTDVV